MICTNLSLERIIVIVIVTVLIQPLQPQKLVHFLIDAINKTSIVSMVTIYLAMRQFPDVHSSRPERVQKKEKSADGGKDIKWKKRLV